MWQFIEQYVVLYKQSVSLHESYLIPVLWHKTLS